MDIFATFGNIVRRSL